MSRYCRRPILASYLGFAAALSLTLTPPAWAAPPPATGAPAEVPGAAPESADSLSERAIQRFQAKDYDGAVADFNRAYALDPDPNYLFNIGRVYEEAADLAQAVDYYERFIKEPGVDLDSRGIALERMRILRAILHETQPEPEPAPAPAPAPEPVVMEPPPAPPEAGPSKAKGRGLRIGGAVLLGLGGGALIGGGVVGGLTLRQARLLGETDGYDARQELIRVGTINAQVTDALLISGGVLAATGLTMLLIGRHSGRAAADDASLARRGLRVAPWIGGAVQGAAVTGRF